MDRKKLLLFGALVLFVSFFLFQYFSKPTLITVTGTGKVKIQPTQATMVVTVANGAIGASQALSDNQNLTNKVIASAKRLGISQTDIEVAYAQMTPTDLGKGQVLYQAVNTIGLTLKNLKNFNRVVNQLYADGAYSVGNIVFTTENSQETEKQAVASATQDAQQRVTEIAKSLHKSVGRMVSVTTSEVGSSGAVSGQGGSSVASSPDQIEIQRQASIVFELK